jgi:hypothetical protein
MTASYLATRNPLPSKESRPSQLPYALIPLFPRIKLKKALQQRLFTQKNNKPFASTNLLLGNFSFCVSFPSGLFKTKII